MPIMQIKIKRLISTKYTKKYCNAIITNLWQVSIYESRKSSYISFLNKYFLNTNLLTQFSSFFNWKCEKKSKSSPPIQLRWQFLFLILTLSLWFLPNCLKLTLSNFIYQIELKQKLNAHSVWWTHKNQRKRNSLFVVNEIIAWIIIKIFSNIIYV